MQRIIPNGGAGEKKVVERETTIDSEGYRVVDNIKRRVAVDVEWNPKDGNLDRDIGVYRSMRQIGMSKAAVIIARDLESIRAHAFSAIWSRSRSETRDTLGLSMTPTKLPIRDCQMQSSWKLPRFRVE